MLKKRFRRHTSWLHLPFIYKTYRKILQFIKDLGLYGDRDVEAKEEVLIIIDYILDHREYTQIIPPLPTDLQYMAEEASIYIFYLDISIYHLISFPNDNCIKDLRISKTKNQKGKICYLIKIRYRLAAD